jgi:hypothetical protein
MAYYGTKSNLEKDRNYKYHNKDLKRAANYKSLETVVETFSDLKNVNSDSFDIVSIENAKFFIVRSNNDDDIHKVYLNLPFPFI